MPVINLTLKRLKTAVHKDQLVSAVSYFNVLMFKHGITFSKVLYHSGERGSLRQRESVGQSACLGQR